MAFVVISGPFFVLIFEIYDSTTTLVTGLFQGDLIFSKKQYNLPCPLY